MKMILRIKMKLFTWKVYFSNTVPLWGFKGAMSHIYCPRAQNIYVMDWWDYWSIPMTWWLLCKKQEICGYPNSLSSLYSGNKNTSCPSTNLFCLHFQQLSDTNIALYIQCDIFIITTLDVSDSSGWVAYSSLLQQHDFIKIRMHGKFGDGAKDFRRRRWSVLLEDLQVTTRCW